LAGPAGWGRFPSAGRDRARRHPDRPAWRQGRRDDPHISHAVAGSHRHDSGSPRSPRPIRRGDFRDHSPARPVRGVRAQRPGRGQQCTRELPSAGYARTQGPHEGSCRHDRSARCEGLRRRDQSDAHRAGRLASGRPHRRCQPFRPRRLGPRSLCATARQQRLSSRPDPAHAAGDAQQRNLFPSAGQATLHQERLPDLRQRWADAVGSLRQHDDRIQGSPELSAGRCSAQRRRGWPLR